MKCSVCQSPAASLVRGLCPACESRTSTIAAGSPANSLDPRDRSALYARVRRALAAGMDAERAAYFLASVPDDSLAGSKLRYEIQTAAGLEITPSLYTRHLLEERNREAGIAEAIAERRAELAFEASITGSRNSSGFWDDWNAIPEIVRREREGM